MKHAVILALSLALLATSAAKGLSAVKCNMEQSWPPPANRTIPWHELNLDLAPEDRWTEIVTQHADGIRAVINQVIDYLIRKPAMRVVVERILDQNAEVILGKFPAEYRAEFEGIQKATGIDRGTLAVMQVMYEISGVCTSIVAQNSDNNVYHARNLDFGIGLGWDNTTDTWKLTELLRPLLLNVRVLRNGTNLYNATYYAGYVGLLTGAKKGSFSITVDTRFDDRLDKYFLEWLEGKWQGQELGMLTRLVMENNNTYAEALNSLSNLHIVGPAYIILGGLNPGEGAVITRNASGARDVWTLDQQRQQGKYYLAQTNYDHWYPDPPFDNRRDHADACLDEVGSQAVRPESLFNVLSAKPNLNLLTTYTTLIHVASGRYESFLQYCEGPCAPF